MSSFRARREPVASGQPKPGPRNLLTPSTYPVCILSGASNCFDHLLTCRKVSFCPSHFTLVLVSSSWSGAHASKDIFLLLSLVRRSLFWVCIRNLSWYCIFPPGTFLNKKISSSDAIWRSSCSWQNSTHDPDKIAVGSWIPVSLFQICTKCMLRTALSWVRSVDILQV